MSKLLTPENILNLLLIFVPIAIVMEFMHASATLIFTSSPHASRSFLSRG